MTAACPDCGSERTRRGGSKVWGVYIVLLLLAVPAVLDFHLRADIVAGIMVAVGIIAHLLFGQRVCLDCGAQWRAG